MKIEIRNLTKSYPHGVTALDDISLTIESGMFGLLGPNGAGKTTLMKILATLMKPTGGSVTIDSYNLSTNYKEIRKMLGYLPQEFGAYPKLSGEEFIDYIASINGISNSQKRGQIVAKVLQEVGLDQVRDRRVKKYSGGMLRRLGIAQALVGDPKLLIVDEPTTGLDPEERIRFRNLLAEISRNKVIMLSTHIVGDISSTCEDIALLSRGQIKFRGHPNKLIQCATGKVWQLTVPQENFSEIKNEYPIISMIIHSDRLDLRIVGDDAAGYDAQSMEPNIEDAYVYFMEKIAGTEVIENGE